VDAAVDAGIQRIVYTSFIGASPDAVFTLARDHYATEEHIRQTGLAHTFLRDSMYMDFLPFFASPEGVIAGPAGEGKCAWVARDDIADVAVAVLTQEGHDGRTYELTGPESRTLEWAAEILSDHLGREITYEDESIDEAWESRAHHGAPDWEVEGWISSYVAVAEGELDVVTDAVPALTGHEAMSLPEFLEANPESVTHLE
jgi:NAD(P)H dehydrogenase (quinone)